MFVLNYFLTKLKTFMKNLKIVFLIFISTFSFSAMAQTIGNYIDILHLKNGSLIKGVIIEQIPGESVRIKTSDGSEYVYLESDVAKFTREEKTELSKTGTDNPLSYINNYKRKEKGYFFELEGFSGGLGSGLRFTNGYRFNQYAKLGVALGIESINVMDYTNNFSPMLFQKPAASVNIVFSGDILKKRITPFYQVELGYGFDINNAFRYSSYGISANGLMAAAMFGVRFKTKKKIDYKLGLDLRTMQSYSSSFGLSKQPILGVRFGIGF